MRLLRKDTGQVGSRFQLASLRSRFAFSIGELGLGYRNVARTQGVHAVFPNCRQPSTVEAISSTTGGATSPGCPPGYNMRGGVRPYEYSASGYTYAAPCWYCSWVNADNSWRYRLYPYSNYHYHAYVARDYRDGQVYRDNRDDRGNGYDNDRSGDRRPSGWYDRYGRYYDRNGVFHMGR